MCLFSIEPWPLVDKYFGVGVRSHLEMPVDPYETLYYLQQGFYYIDPANSPNSSAIINLQNAESKITQLVRRVQQQERWVYQPVGSHSPEYISFTQKTATLSRSLLGHRQILAEQVNACSILYTRLHEDILVLIFDYATTETHAGDPFPIQRVLSGSLRLASVTRMWRNIALRTSFLWSSIRIASWDQDDRVGYGLFLGRSKGGYLHLHIDISSGWGPEFDDLIVFLAGVAHRVRSLVVRVGYNPPLDFHQLFAIPYSNVKVVNINSDIPVPILSMPSASHLRIRAGVFQRDTRSYSSITFLEVDDVSAYDLWTLLHALTSLRTLKATMEKSGVLQINSDSGSFTIDGDGVDPFIHAALQVLHLDCGDILFAFSFPSLKRLCIWGSHSSLADFLERSGCQLTSFGLSHPEDLVFLDQLPTVNDLCVKAYSLRQFGDFFRHLKERMDRPAPPHVRSITIDVDERLQWTRFMDAPSYLFSPFLFYYDEHGKKLDCITIQTQTPTDFYYLWEKLSESVPVWSNVYINGQPMYNFRRSTSTTTCFSPDAVGRDCLDLRDRIMSVRLHTRKVVSATFDVLHPASILRSVKVWYRQRPDWGSEGLGPSW